METANGHDHFSQNEAQPIRRRRHNTLPMPMVADRLPPHSIESEQGLLGSILLDPKETLGLCAGKILSSDLFYDMRHQALYDALMAMYDAAQMIDMITLQQYLRDRNQLEALGGLPYISGLTTATPSASNLEYYLDIVQRKFVLRTLIQKSVQTVSACYDGEEHDEYAILENAEREILSVGQSLQTGGEDVGVKELAQRVAAVIEDAWENKGKPRGMTVGFPDIDSLTGGFRAGQLIVLGGRPSTGKSSLAMNFAESTALDQKIPTGVFSLEMTSDDLAFRLACCRSRLDSKRARDGTIYECDFPKLTSALGRLSSSPLYICEKSGLTLRQICARARRWYQRYKIQFLVIDYIQLIASKSKENRNSQLTEISNGLKVLAKELKIPILVLSQISREVEKENRPPRMSDLRDCGAIEQDADLILLLDPKQDKKKKNETQDENEINKPEVEVNCWIPKHRGGPTGRIELIFMKNLTRYESKSKCSDVPERSYDKDA